MVPSGIVPTKLTTTSPFPGCFVVHGAYTGTYDFFAPSPLFEDEPMESPFKVGDHVYKIGGDYRFEGVVVAVFAKLSGAVRYVVEDDRGVLHIYSEKNLGPKP